MSHSKATPQTPRNPRLKEGWRAAAAAYRKAYGEHSHPHRGCAQEAFAAAEAALRRVLPELPQPEASRETVAAVHYASWAHPKWLYALHRLRPPLDLQALKTSF